MKEEAIDATIITIGDELLIGQVIDTNSAWIAQELNKIGIWVKRRIAVGDVWEDIWKTLDEECSRSQLVIITGGLGPTADDITKPLLCTYFGGKLVMNEEVLQHVRYLSEVVYKRPFIERNAKQAEVPDVCTVLKNERGSAPGMWFEKNQTIIISLPGVPFEMKGIMADEAIPKLKKYFTPSYIVHRTILTWGIGESFLADRLQGWEEQLPEFIKLAYLPNYGMVRLRLTAKGKNELQVTNAVNKELVMMKQLVQEWMIAEEDVTMQQVVRSLLESRQKTIGTAESCTGGFIAHLLTAKPGASAVYKGSIISYANEIKTGLLGVENSLLQENGAVSEATVRAMVAGALEKLPVDYIIATSGIMGPDGGTASKPVGTVWIAVGDRDQVVAKKFHFRFDRARNIELTANNALFLLRNLILKTSPAQHTG